MSEEGPPKLRSELAERSLKKANERLCRSTHHKNPVIWYGYNAYMVHNYAYMIKVAEIRESESYAETTQAAKWREAREEEMHALPENETLNLVGLPKGIKTIGCRWVYKVKCNVDNSSNKEKAQLVAKGYTQMYDIDYDESFTPITKMTMVRMVLAGTKESHLQKNVKLCLGSGMTCDATRFRQVVGSLIYLTITRSDFSYPVGLVSQCMS